MQEYAVWQPLRPYSAVSYTHLDVYKRQAGSHEKAIHASEDSHAYSNCYKAHTQSAHCKVKDSSCMPVSYTHLLHIKHVV